MTKTQTQIGAYQGSRALLFNDYNQIFDFAKMVTKTDLSPKAFKGKPEEATIAIIYGMEIGLPPMASLQNIAVVNGAPTVWGDAQLSLVQSSGKYEYHKSFFEGDGETLKAIFEVKRTGSKEPVIKEFSVADAKKANLWGKAGTWTTHPKVMLSYKARAFALREAFADILKGIHSAEEMEGEQIIDVTPKSKTANAHTLPDSIDEAFKPVVEVQQEQVVDEVITDNSEAIENAFKKITDGIKSMTTARAVNFFLEKTCTSELELIKAARPDYYSEIFDIKMNKLEELAK